MATVHRSRQRHKLQRSSSPNSSIIKPLIAIRGSRNSKVELRRDDDLLDWLRWGEIDFLVEVPLSVDSDHMGRVEDVHTILMRMICYSFKEEFLQGK